MTIAIGSAVAILVAAALVYVFLIAKEPAAKFNGAAIVAAAHAYTLDLRVRKQTVPESVTIDDLVTAHFLKPEEAAVVHGVKAAVMLTATEDSPQTVIMRVQFPDGSRMELLADGNVQQFSR